MRGSSGARVGGRGDLSGDEIGVQQGERFAHEFVDVDRAHFPFPALVQRAEPTDDLSRTIVFRHDVVADRAQFVEIDIVTPQHLPRRFGVAQNRCERLVQLVRDRCRQLAEQRDARHVPQRRAVLLGFQFGDLALRDVDRNAAQPAHVRLGTPTRREPSNLVPLHHAVFDVQFLVVLHGVAYRALQFLAIGRMGDLEHLVEVDGRRFLRQRRMRNACGAIGGAVHFALRRDVPDPVAQPRGASGQHHPPLARLQCRGGAPLQAPFIQQRRDQTGLQHDHGERNQRRMTVRFPERRLLEANDRVVWQLFLGDPPTARLSPVDLQCRSRMRRHFDRTRRHAFEQTAYQAGRIFADRAVARHATANDAGSDEGVERAVDGRTRCLGDDLRRFARTELTAGAVGEEARRKDDVRTTERAHALYDGIDRLTTQ